MYDINFSNGSLQMPDKTFAMCTQYHPGNFKYVPDVYFTHFYNWNTEALILHSVFAHVKL